MRTTNHVRVMREALGLSLRGLAAQVGTSYETIRRIESIQDYVPKYRLVHRLADFFGVDADALFERESAEAGVA